jgi:hypothetical protein
MTVLNLRFYPNLFVAACLLAGCTMEKKPPIHRCQALVVLDKTNSVSYSDRAPDFQQEFAGKFERTYASATRDIQCSSLIITGRTRVFPELNYFDKDCPGDAEDSRSGQEALRNWKTEKRKWISNEIKKVDSLLRSPCNSNRTDIFSIFSGIDQVQKDNGPWDSINVFIFSDLINTTGLINMLTEINTNNAHEKGVHVCQSLIDHRQISAGNTQNLYLTIYTPSNMENTGQVNQFWKGFFEKWGLLESHYHFE